MSSFPKPSSPAWYAELGQLVRQVVKDARGDPNLAAQLLVSRMKRNRRLRNQLTTPVRRPHGRRPLWSSRNYQRKRALFAAECFLRDVDKSDQKFTEVNNVITNLIRDCIVRGYESAVGDLHRQLQEAQYLVDRLPSARKKEKG